MSIRHARRFHAGLSVLPLFILTLLVGTMPATAQIDESDPIPGTTVGSDFKNNTYFAVGAHASFLSGAGLGGRVSFPRGFAVQLTSFVISAGGITHFNIGSEAQYSFIQGDGGRLYGLVGGGYYLSTSNDSTKPGNRINSPLHLGLGIGYEWFVSRNASLSFALPFTWFIEDKKVGPIPSLSFYYYFR